jgi:hypothetical protein
MANQMIALQARNPQISDPQQRTARLANMVNMARQAEASQLQGARTRQEMDYAEAAEGRAVQTQASAQKRAELEYVGLAAKQFSEDVAKLKEGDIAGAEAVRADIVAKIPSWNNYIRPASEWTPEYVTQLMSKASEIVAQTNPPAKSTIEYSAKGALDAQGRPLPEGTPIQVVTGRRPSATPILAAGGAATPAPGATPTAPQAMGTGADMRATQGSNTTPQDLFSQGMDPNSIPTGMPTVRPASFSQSDMGGAGAGQMAPDVMSRIVDSAFNTGVMAQVDFDQLLASQPPQNKQALVDSFRRANITLQADAPSLADSAMGQQSPTAANPVQTPQARFADMRGPTPQSRTANLGGDMPMVRTTEAQYIPVQRRDPNVGAYPGSATVPLSRVGAEKTTEAQATKNVELNMAPQIAAATKKAERAIELKSEAPKALSATKNVVNGLDDYIDTIDRLLRSPDRSSIVGRFEGRIPYVLQDERQAELQADFDKIKNTDTLTSLVEMKQASPTGGSPVGNASNQDVLLVARGANSLVQTGGVSKFDQELKNIRRQAYRARQTAIEEYNNRYGELAASDPRFKLTPRATADRYISTKDLPQNKSSAGGRKTSVIPDAAKQMLRKNPSPQQRAFFDRTFGAGAAAKVLGAR